MIFIAAQSNYVASDYARAQLHLDKFEWRYIDKESTEKMRGLTGKEHLLIDLFRSSTRYMIDMAYSRGFTIVSLGY